MPNPTLINWELLPEGANPATGIAPLSTDPVLIDRKVREGARARIVACFTGISEAAFARFCAQSTPHLFSGRMDGDQAYFVFRTGMTVDAAREILRRNGLLPLD